MLLKLNRFCTRRACIELAGLAGTKAVDLGSLNNDVDKTGLPRHVEPQTHDGLYLRLLNGAYKKQKLNFCRYLARHVAYAAMALRLGCIRKLAPCNTEVLAYRQCAHAWQLVGGQAW